MDTVLASKPTTPEAANPKYPSTALVTVHRHSLGVPAQFPVGRWRDRSTAGVSSSCAALLECQKLLGAEGLVVNLRSGLDQILEMGTSEEVSQIDEFAVVFVLNVDHSPSVLASTDLLSPNND